MIKTQSLNENHRFRALYGRGKNKTGKAMSVYVMRNRLGKVDRLGLTVSKKIGNAVTRNHVRRTGEIEGFTLMKEMPLDPISGRYLLVGLVGRDGEVKMGDDIDKIRNIF